MNNKFDRVPLHLGDSPLLSRLAQYYALAPSAVLIRTAEAELLRAVSVKPPALDLCCGDGFFASLIRPSGFEAGCDITESALHQADSRNVYRHLVCADIVQGIPFPNSYFNTIVSNSSLEHVEDIDGALREIWRVLKPAGRLYTTFASHFAYEWWPCGKKALSRYLDFQPVYSYFSIEEWERRMGMAGLRVVGYKYYLSKTATRQLIFLDYHFSHVYITCNRTLARPFVRAMRRIPPTIWASLWKKMFAKIKILARDSGGGILIVAERDAM